jgi:metal-responsive CopG/Arc/MetJ family transcriptional regulator
MPRPQLLSVRVSSEDLDKLDQLDQLAELQGRSRSQLVQEALAELVNNDQDIRSRECRRLRKRLKSAIEEQCAIMDQASFSDEHRSF